MRRPLAGIILSVATVFSLGAPVFATDYTLNECKETTEKLIRQAVPSESFSLFTQLWVESSQESPRRLVISGKALPAAYLASLDDKQADALGTKMPVEVANVLARAPLHMLAAVDCPQSLDDAAVKKSFAESLENAMQAVADLASQQTSTNVLKEFMHQFADAYNDTKEILVRDTEHIFPAGYSMKSQWSIRERFTDFTFQSLRITFDYCAYFLGPGHNSPEQVDEKRRMCWQEQTRHFEFVVDIKDAISQVLASKAKALSREMLEYHRLLILKESNDTI